MLRFGWFAISSLLPLIRRGALEPQYTLASIEIKHYKKGIGIIRRGLAQSTSRKEVK